MHELRTEVAVATFLGVSRNIAFLQDKPGQENYWCVGGSTGGAKPGDQLLLYFPASVSESKSGIAQVYEITSLPQQLNRSQCYDYGMRQVATKLVLNLPVHLKASRMKTNPQLQKWGALSRNFQGVTFAIDKTVWPALRSMIVANNPEANDVLTPAEPE